MPVLDSISTKALIHLWAMFMLALLASDAGAKERALPTETDLRAAYCIPIMRDAIDTMKSLATLTERADDRETFTEAVTDYEASLRRLKLYLLPRSRHLDKAGLLIAIERGEEDLKLQQTSGCGVQCRNIIPNPSWRVCINQCQAKSAFHARTKACYELDWLPY